MRNKPDPFLPDSTLDGADRPASDGGRDRPAGDGGRRLSNSGSTAVGGRGSLLGRYVQGQGGASSEKKTASDIESQAAEPRSSDESFPRCAPTHTSVGIATPPLTVIKSAAVAVLQSASIVAGGGEEPTPRSAAAVNRAREELQHNLRHNIDSVHNVLTALFLASTALMISPKCERCIQGALCMHSRVCSPV